MSHFTADDKADIQRERWLAEMREKKVITIWLFGTLLWKRGVNNLQHSERKNWRRIVPACNLDNKRRGVQRGSDASYARGREVNIIYY